MAPAAVSAVDVFERGVCDQPAADDAAVCKDKELCSTADNPAECKKTGEGAQNPLFGQGGVLTKIVSLLSVVVAIVSIIVIILAGLKFVTSGSNPQDVTNARERIIYALLALVVAALAQVLVRFVIGSV